MSIFKKYRVKKLLALVLTFAVLIGNVLIDNTFNIYGSVGAIESSFFNLPGAYEKALELVGTDGSALGSDFDVANEQLNMIVATEYKTANTALTGENIDYTFGLTISSLTNTVSDMYMVYTIPETLNQDTIDFSNAEYVTGWQIGTLNNQKVLVVNIASPPNGGTQFGWVAAFDTETTPADAMAVSNAYVLFSIEGEEEGTLHVLGGKVETTAKIDKDMTITKQPIANSDGSYYKKELKDGKYVYTVEYEINVQRDIAVHAIGSALVSEFVLTDEIKNDAGGGAPLGIWVDGVSIEDSTTVTKTLTSDDFTDVANVDQDDNIPYQLKQPVRIKVEYDAATFLPESEASSPFKLTNEATGTVRFIGETSPQEVKSGKAVIDVDYVQQIPGFEIGKKVVGSQTLNWADPAHTDLPMSFQMEMKNSGTTILDKAILTDKDFTFKDSSNQDIALTLGTDYTIDSITIPNFEGKATKVEVFYLNAQNEWKLIEDATSTGNSFTVQKANNIWYGVKVEATNLIDGQFIGDITDADAQNDIVLHMSLKSNSAQTSFAELTKTAKVINQTEGSYVYKTAESTEEMTASAEFDIAYPTLQDVTLTKAYKNPNTTASPSASPAPIPLKDFSATNGKDIEFTITYKNTTGYKLDTVTITDDLATQLKFFEGDTLVSGMTATLDSVVTEPSNLGAVSTANNVFSWVATNVPVGAQVTFTVKVNVKNDNALVFNKITNQAKVAYSYGGITNEKDSNEAIVNVVDSADMSISKRIVDNTNKMHTITKETGKDYGSSSTMSLLAPNDNNGNADGLMVNDQTIVYRIEVTNTGNREIKNYTLYEGVGDSGLKTSNDSTADYWNKSTFVDVTNNIADIVKVTSDTMDGSVVSIVKNTTGKLGFSAQITETLQPGESKVFFVHVNVKKVNKDTKYAYLGNRAKVEYFQNGENEVSGSSAKVEKYSNSVKTTFTKPAFTNSVTKTLTDTSIVDEPQDLLERDYQIKANIQTNIRLQTVTIEDTGIKFYQNGTEMALPVGRVSTDYAWIKSITVPNFFAEGQPLYGSSAKGHIEYKLVGDTNWTKLSGVALENSVIYTDNEYIANLETLVTTGRVHQVRVVFEDYPAIFDEATKLPFEKIFEGITVTAGFADLYQLANAKGDFEMKNEARVELTPYEGEGTGAIFGGEAIKITKPIPSLELEKTANPTEVTYEEIALFGKNIEYTINATNVGATVTQMRVYDKGLFLDNGAPLNNYGFESIKVKIVDAKGYVGSAKLYYSTNMSDTPESFMHMADISINADSEYVFNLSSLPTDTYIKRFYIVFGREEAPLTYWAIAQNDLPKGFDAIITANAVVLADPTFPQDTRLIQNTVDLELIALEQTAYDTVTIKSDDAETTIMYKPNATVEKSARVGFATDAETYNTYNTSDNSMNLQLADILSANGKAVSYKLKVHQKSPHNADIILTDKSQTFFNNSTTAGPHKMMLSAVYYPQAYNMTINNAFVNNIRKSGEWNAVETVTINGLSYNKYTPKTGVVAEGFEVAFVEVNPGAIFDVYVDYVIKDVYNNNTVLTKVANTASVAAEKNGAREESPLDIVNDDVTASIPFINQNLKKEVTYGKTMNLSSLVKGQQEVEFKVTGIGHNAFSDATLKNFTLTDNGLTITNSKNSKTYSVGGANEIAPYAWISEVTFVAHGVSGLDIPVRYTLVGDSLPKQANWSAGSDLTIEGKIAKFWTQQTDVPVEFKNEEIRMTAVLEKANETNFYGYNNGVFPLDESTVFTLKNHVKQEAESEFAVGSKVSSESEDFMTVKASKKPTMELTKSGKVQGGALYQSNWYLGDQQLSYTISGIANDTLETLDEVVVEDTGLSFVKVNGTTSQPYEIKNIKVLKESGANFDGVVTIDETKNSLDRTQSFKVTIKNLPAGEKLKITYDVTLYQLTDFNTLKDITSVKNEVKGSYTVSGSKTDIGKREENISVKVIAPDYMIIKKANQDTGKLNVRPNDVVTWDIYVANNKQDANHVTSILIDPLVTDVLPKAFNDKNNIKVEKIAFGKAADVSTANGVMAYVPSEDVALTLKSDDPSSKMTSIELTDSYNLTWQFEGSLKFGEVIHIQLKTKVSPDVEPITATNKASVLGVAQGIPEKDAIASVYITRVEGIFIVKESAGDLSGMEVGKENFRSFPNYAEVSPGSVAKYRITFANYLSATRKDIVIGDILPYVDDKEMSFNGIKRSSKWAPTLNGNFEVQLWQNDTHGFEEKVNDVAQDEYAIWLSKQTGSNYADIQEKIKDPTTLEGDANWAKLGDIPPAEIGQYKSFLVVFVPAYSLEKGQKIKVVFDVDIPAYESAVWDNYTYGTDMYLSENSVAYQDFSISSKPITYPNKALMNVVLSELGDKVWLDANKDGLQTDGESGYGNMNVYLFRVDSEGNKTLHAKTKTDKNGNYRFTRVPAGKYVVGFEKQNAYDFTKRTDDGSLAETDSNVSQSSTVVTESGLKFYFSDEVTVGSDGKSTSNLTIDAGLVTTPAPPPPGPDPDPTPEVTPTPTSSTVTTATPTPSSEATPTPSTSSGATPTPSTSSGATPTPSTSSEATPTPSTESEATPTPSSTTPPITYIPVENNDNEYIIYDEEGTPLGSFTVPEGMSIEDFNAEEIFENMIPFGEVKLNPKTGDQTTPLVIFASVAGFIFLAWLLKFKRRQDK